MTETQQRFLRAIAERVPMNQVVELHLFPPIRQGGVETGVAVVAEDPRPAPNVPVAASAVAVADPSPAEVDVTPLPAADDPTATAIAVSADGAGSAMETPAEAGPPAGEPASEGEAPERSPYADDPGGGSAPSAAIASEEDMSDRAPVSATNGHVPAAPFARLTIHTARYRLTLKGVDRGKWEVDVVAEADAPLEAVDAVIRGVQRRAGGEGAEPDRLNAEAFRGALEAPLATLER